MSRSGSRYPSAFGHTPSYRSYSSIDASAPYTSTTSTSLGDYGSKSVFGRGGLLDSTDLALGSYGLGPSDVGTKSSSAAKVSSYSSSYSSSSTSKDGGRPVVEYSSDSTYKARAVGDSGIPHTSYAHSSSNYSSENPYKNRVSSYSYNV